jgi:hypothetical protein
MKLEVILNGKLTERNIPASWDQVTFKQFLDLIDCVDDYVKAISVFTGVDADIIKKAKIKGLYDVMHTLGFLRQECQTRVPERILFYPVPKDLSFETIAQYEDLRAAINSTATLSRKEQLAKYTFYCAVFACREMSIERTRDLAMKYPNEGIKYGEYHPLKAEAMQDEFLNAPAPEVLGIGNFTLTNLTALSLGIKVSYQKPITQVKRLKLVLKRWALRLGLWEHLTTWSNKPMSKDQNYSPGLSTSSSPGSDSIAGKPTH